MKLMAYALFVTALGTLMLSPVYDGADLLFWYLIVASVAAGYLARI